MSSPQVTPFSSLGTSPPSSTSPPTAVFHPNENTLETSTMVCWYWWDRRHCTNGRCKYAHFWEPGMRIASQPQRVPGMRRAVAGQNLARAQQQQQRQQDLQWQQEVEERQRQLQEQEREREQEKEQEQRVLEQWLEQEQQQREEQQARLCFCTECRDIRLLGFGARGAGRTRECLEADEQYYGKKLWADVDAAQVKCYGRGDW